MKHSGCFLTMLRGRIDWSRGFSLAHWARRTGCPPGQPVAPRPGRPALIVMLIAAMFCARSLAQEVPPPIPNLDARLSALDPSDPEPYFLLAEEVASEMPDRDGQDLARTLYVLAFEIDRHRVGEGAGEGGEGGGKHALSRSVCLALADMVRLERDRRWLMALAQSVGHRDNEPDWNPSGSAVASDQTAFLVAELLGDVRAGDGIAARKLLDQPAVAAMLREYERLLAPSGEAGAASRIERYANEWPCPECHNRRIVPSRHTTPVRQRLCYYCNGNPGPTLTRPEFIAHLRFESRMLNGIQRSWAAQIATDLGAPLRELDPDELAPTLGVDPTKTLWRDGQWVAPDNPTPPPSPTTQPPPVKPIEKEPDQPRKKPDSDSTVGT